MVNENVELGIALEKITIIFRTLMPLNKKSKYCNMQVTWLSAMFHTTPEYILYLLMFYS